MSDILIILTNITDLIPRLPEIPLSQDINYTSNDIFTIAIITSIFGLTVLTGCADIIYKKNCRKYNNVEIRQDVL